MAEIAKKVKPKSIAMKQAIKWTTRRELEQLLDREAERQKLLVWLQRNKIDLQATIGKRETAIRALSIVIAVETITLLVIGAVYAFI